MRCNRSKTSVMLLQPRTEFWPIIRGWDCEGWDTEGWDPEGWGLGPTTAPRAQTCTFEGDGASNITKFPREDPQREGKKRAKFWAVPAEGDRRRGSGAGGLGGGETHRHTVTPHTDTHADTLAKGSAKWIGRKWMAIWAGQNGRA